MATIAVVKKTTLEGAVLLVDGVERCRVEVTPFDCDAGSRSVQEAVARWRCRYPHAKTVQITGDVC